MRQVSNHADHGLTMFGTTFHHDGMFEPEPFLYGIFTIEEVPNWGGATHFADIRPVLERMREENPRLLERMRTLHGFCRSTEQNQSLMYTHPLTGKELLLHYGEAIAEWKGAPEYSYRNLSSEEQKDVEDEYIRFADVRMQHTDLPPPNHQPLPPDLVLFVPRALAWPCTCAARLQRHTWRHLGCMLGLSVAFACRFHCPHMVQLSPVRNFSIFVAAQRVAEQPSVVLPG